MPHPEPAQAPLRKRRNYVAAVEQGQGMTVSPFMHHEFMGLKQ
jgi:hypothetical protein